MAKQRKHCEASIARVYSEYLRATKPVQSPPPVSLDTRCIDSHRSKTYDDSNAYVSGLLKRLTSQEYNGADVDVRLWTTHIRVEICGVEFTSGQPMTGVRKLN